MSTYSQPGTKRQKMKEGRVGENVDYFQGIEKIEYNKMASITDSGSYRYYNSSEKVHSCTMEDWLKYSVSLTEFRSNGFNVYSKQMCVRSWDDHTNTIDNNKRCIKALFEFCNKLGVKYWTAFDSDLIPMANSWEENRSNWEEIVEYVQEITQKYHMKLLWLAPDLHSHPRYVSGAFTSNDATVFVQAATQIKKCLEISQRLKAECFLLWPCREGYDAIFLSDVAREIKLFARLLKITAEFRERLNYRCQLLIMPYNNIKPDKIASNASPFSNKWEGVLINCYMWDVTSCLYLLKCYNLDHHYKVCAPPGHHMYMANVYNMLGGVCITNGVDHSNTRTMTLMMKCIIDQGSTPPGGINLRLTRRPDSDLHEMFSTYIKFIDAIARSLRLASVFDAEQIFSKQMQHRYSTYHSGFGSRLLSSEISIEECEEYYKKNQTPHGELQCTRSEHMEIAFQRYLDTCEHV